MIRLIALLKAESVCLRDTDLSSVKPVANINFLALMWVPEAKPSLLNCLGI